MVTLVEAGGAERRFRLHDAFEFEGANLYLVEDEADPAEVMLLRETEDGLEPLTGAGLDRVMTQLQAEDDEPE